MRVNLGHGVAPFFRGEEPVVKVHHESTYYQCRDRLLNHRDARAIWRRPPPIVLRPLSMLSLRIVRKCGQFAALLTTELPDVNSEHLTPADQLTPKQQVPSSSPGRRTKKSWVS